MDKIITVILTQPTVIDGLGYGPGTQAQLPEADANILIRRGGAYLLPGKHFSEETNSVSEMPPSPEIQATESAKKLAKAHGISLLGIEGSGPDGKVVKADVERLING